MMGDGPTSIGLSERTERALAYLFGWVTGLIFFIFERKNRNVQYARVQVYRSSVLTQDEKAFYIAPPNHRPRIITSSRKRLLKLFPYGKSKVMIYFAV